MLSRIDAVGSKVGEIPQRTVISLGRRKRMAGAGNEVPNSGGADFRDDDENPSFSLDVGAGNAGALGLAGGGVDVFMDDEVEANRRR